MRRFEAGPGVDIVVNGPARVEASEAVIVGGQLEVVGTLTLASPRLTLLETGRIVAQDCQATAGPDNGDEVRDRLRQGLGPSALDQAPMGVGQSLLRGAAPEPPPPRVANGTSAVGTVNALTFGCARAADLKLPATLAPRQLATAVDDSLALLGPDEGIAVAHAVVVAIGVAAALVQAVTDCGRAACSLPPLHSGPTSQLVRSLPSLFTAGVGVLDLAEHGQFTLLLSQLHAQAPPVIHRAGSLMVPATGLVPGTWSLLEPLLRPDMAPLNVSAPVNPDTDPHAVQVLVKALGVPSTWLLKFAVSSFGLLQLLIVFAFCIPLADVVLKQTRRWGRSRGERAPATGSNGLLAGQGGEAGTLAPQQHAAGGPALSGSESRQFDSETALAHRMITTMVSVGAIYFRALAMLSFNDMRLPLALTGSEWRRADGWITFAFVTVGFTLLVCFMVMSERPCISCPAACGKLGRNLRRDEVGPGHAFAYEGRGARLVDPAGRAKLYDSRGRSWLIVRQLSGILTAGVLVWLSQRPGAQAGLMTNAQSVTLLSLLVFKPWSSEGAWFVDTFVFGMRGVVLLLALEFVPPFGAAGTAPGAPVGSALVAMQTVVAMVLTGLVLVRFPLVARVAASCAARPADEGLLPVDEPGSPKGPSPPGSRTPIDDRSRVLELAKAQAGSLRFQNNPMMATAAKPPPGRRAGQSALQGPASPAPPAAAGRKAFKPSEAGRSQPQAAAEGDIVGGEDSSGGLQQKSGIDDMEGGQRPEEMLNATSTHAAARASRLSQRLPKENPLLIPKRKSKSKLT